MKRSINVGEDNPSAKLTPKMVEKIRSLRGKVTQRDLADRFGVCHSQISNIQTGKSWKPNDE